MQITSKTKGVVDEGWRYKYEGDIETREGLEITLDKGLYVTGSIKAGESIKAGRYIRAGDNYGVSAGLQITCKKELFFGLKAFAGVCTWREITDEEKTITCSKMVGGGVVEYGILVETGEQKHTITIDGKNIELSEASFNNLKEQLK